MVAKSWALAFLPLLLLIFSLEVGSMNPGLVVRITQSGLNYVNHQGIIILRREISTISLQDFTGDYYVSYIGSVGYCLSSLVIKETHLKNSYLGFLPGEGIQVSIYNSSIFLTGNWEIAKFFMTFSGTFYLKIEQIYVSVSLRLGTDHSARPTVTISNCSSLIGSVSISFSGTFGWLVNLFQGGTEPAMKSLLEKKICDKVRSAADLYLQPYLQTLPVTVNVDAVSSLDYSLLGPPQITNQSLEMMFKGEFFSTSHRSPIPFDAPPLNLPQENSHMIYIGISDYLFNTVNMVYQETGIMNFSITNDMIPTETGFTLNTTLFNNLIPKLSWYYPDTPMEFQVYPATSPLVVFSPGKMTITPEIYVEAFVVSPDSLPKSVFLFSVKAKISAKLMLTNGKITGSISPGRLVIQVKHCQVGQFDVSQIENTLNLLASLLLYPTANARLKAGFYLPLTRNFSFYDSILQPYENYLLFGANIQ